MDSNRGSRGGYSNRRGRGGERGGHPHGRGRGSYPQGQERSGHPQGQGRGSHSQGQERSGHYQGQGRGSHSRGQERSGPSRTQFQEQVRGSHHEEQSRPTYHQEQSRGDYSGGQSQDSSNPWGRPRGSHPLSRGGGITLRGMGTERSGGHDRSSSGSSVPADESVIAPPAEPVASSSTWTRSTSETQPFPSAQVVGSMKKMNIESIDDVSVPKEPSKKSRQGKKKKDAPKDEPPSVSDTTTVPSEKVSDSGSADKPKPSTSAQSSDVSKPRATETEAPKTGATTQPTDSRYSEIPKRQKQGPIHAGFNYFYPKTATIEVNYLPIEFSNKNMKIFHYDVEFGDRVNKEISRTLVHEMKKLHYPKRNPAFDGSKNLYAARDPLFPGNSKTATIKITNSNTGREKEYTITVKKAAENVELTISSLYQYIERNGCSTNRPQSTIQAIEVALRGNLPDRFASCGRAFYTQPTERVKLSAGLDLYSGFIQSTVLGQKAYLNVDVSHRGFYSPQPLLDYLHDVISNTARYNQQPDYRQLNVGLSDRVYEILNEYVKQNNGLKMRYKDPRTQTERTYRIKGAHRRNAMEALFELSDGENVRRISVYDYFMKTKMYKIKYPKLPVIEAGSKGDLFPLECCSIEMKQPVVNSYQYSPDEGRAMIANCKDPPHYRKQKIINNIRSANFNRDDVLGEFGIRIGAGGDATKFLQVPAASLRAPAVLYRDNYSDVNNGVWNMTKFVETKTLSDWIIVNTNRYIQANDVSKLQGLLMENANFVGMQMAPPSPSVNLQRTDEVNIENFLKDLKSKKPKLQLIVLILPDDTDVAYRRVKYVSEIKIGLLTQCIKSSTVKRVSWMTARNLLLKINSKLSGINHIMHYPGSNKAIFDGSTMFVGADVTHPRPGTNQSLERSICAVAGSYDKHGSKYKMLYSIQQSREEMILGMERMIQALLMFFAKETGKFPTKMFYFRDGVSDGQFLSVLQTELTAIKSACKKLKTDVRVTFLVVQKRHHTRFFPPRDVADKKGNVLAGTVVNSTITHPTEHDFYLVSHQSILGTARPTKYHVLYDEIREPEDYVEALTYYLCYMFVRCTRAVSYPAPTYYAHLAAARAEKYVKCVKERNSTNLDRDLSAGVLGEGTIHSDMRDRNPMFFV